MTSASHVRHNLCLKKAMTETIFRLFLQTYLYGHSLGSSIKIDRDRDKERGCERKGEKIIESVREFKQDKEGERKIQYARER